MTFGANMLRRLRSTLIKMQADNKLAVLQRRDSSPQYNRVSAESINMRGPQFNYLIDKFSDCWTDV
eukprot:scaffold196135_cov37-Prasinocladus_malaysianus.AAC.1